MEFYILFKCAISVKLIHRLINIILVQWEIVRCSYAAYGTRLIFISLEEAFVQNAKH